jgi:hypothetical protein
MRLAHLVAAVAFSFTLTAGAEAAFVFESTMTGDQERPTPVMTTATGSSTVTVDGDTLTVAMEWTGLTGGTTTAGHIHCCTDANSAIGVAVDFSLAGFGTSDTFNGTFDLLNPATYTMSFLNNFGGGTALGARDALIAGLFNQRAYMNIHNATFPAGEIRGNLAPIPLPAAFWLFAAGALGLGLGRRRA